MTDVTPKKYVYVTYIKTSPEKLWEALTNPAFIRQYWFSMYQDSTWQTGAPWSMHFSDGRVADAGSVLEADPPHRLVLKWRNEFKPELTADGFSTCTYTIEPGDDAVKLTITHEAAQAGSKLIGAVSNGWPRVLANLKSWLETGAVIMSNSGQH